MKTIKESDLIELGFEKHFGFDEGVDNFYYFILDIGSLSFITCTDDECYDSNWRVDIFDCDDIKFFSLKKLKRLIKLLKSGLNER